MKRPRLALLPQAQAFSALLAHAHCYDAQDQRHTQRLVDSYLAMVSLVPVFALRYRPDLQRLPIGRASQPHRTGTGLKGELGRRAARPA